VGDINGETFDPGPAARRLARFWDGWERLDILPPAERPRDVAEGYRVQRRLIDELGEAVAGYKVGLSSVGAMKKSGLGAPIFGFVPKSRLCRSGATIPLPLSDVVVEAEIGFELPADPNAKPAARLVFEIVRSRFREPRIVDMPSFIGDASGFCTLVVGDPVPLGEVGGLLRAGATLSRDGNQVSGPMVGEDCPNPIEVLRLFRLLAAKYDMPVGPGMVVATGSIVVPYEKPAAGTYQARVGRYTATFTGVDER
jgi:2-keto-4-pentenoate hydratase